MKLEAIVKHSMVKLSRIHGGFAYYTLIIMGFAYEFPVDLSQVGEDTLLRDDKAQTFSHWIKKSIDEKTIKLVK